MAKSVENQGFFFFAFFFWEIAIQFQKKNVLRLNQAFQKTPLKATLRIFSKIEFDLPENKMLFNNSYVVPDIFIVIKEVINKL